MMKQSQIDYLVKKQKKKLAAIKLMTSELAEAKRKYEKIEKMIARAESAPCEETKSERVERVSKAKRNFGRAKCGYYCGGLAASGSTTCKACDKLQSSMKVAAKLGRIPRPKNAAPKTSKSRGYKTATGYAGL